MSETQEQLKLRETVLAGVLSGAVAATTFEKWMASEIARLREALRRIDERRYKDRYTVTPDMAWEEFGKANAELCAIYDEASNALS